MSKPNKVKTKAQKARTLKIIEMGCAVRVFGEHGWECRGRITEHHTHVGGSRPNRSPFRNHDKTIGLCENHHQGPCGIDPPGGMGTLPWERIYGSEDYYLEQVNKVLEEQ